MQTVLTEQGDYYSKLAERCVEGGCSVDLFLFPNAHADIASIGLVSLVTGGQTFKYQYFDVRFSLILLWSPNSLII